MLRKNPTASAGFSNHYTTEAAFAYALSHRIFIMESRVYFQNMIAGGQSGIEAGLYLNILVSAC
jgi:hypothetical protein